MTSAPAAPCPRPRLDIAFTQALAVFADVVGRVPADAWERPSPCDGWTVRDVVGHVVGSVVQIGARARGETFARDVGPPGALAPDPPAALGAAAGPARAAVDAADLERPAETAHGPGTLADALAFPVADLAVHAWDVAHAVGGSVTLPPELLAHVVHTAGSVPEEVLRRPGLFGPARPVPDDADDTTRLVAWLGRDPR